MGEDVLTCIEGRVGRIRLNRPKAIHALTFAMCEAMIAALLSWRDDPAVDLVLIDHAAGRGFCAGGDVVALAKSGAVDGADARAFFHSEYRLNHLLFTYGKPTVAMMDGITMGGGVGISQPCRHRIATERTVFAMPETSIGLFPDVGGGRYLSRLPGRIGHYVALTGARLDGANCFALGLATGFVPSEGIAALKARIIEEPSAAARIIAAAKTTPPPAKILELREDIDRLFVSDRYEHVLAALEADGGEWAAEQREILTAKSPQACKVALRELAESRKLHDFADEMRMEYRIAARVVQRPDFAEGVRALLIDKDNGPRWDPPTPDAVSDTLIDGIFAPLPTAEEWSPLA
ncbi:enoyl-CoA hydratase [Sphingomonas oleivorans]|uniref:3-hydroxyisobutyryl-CoA hydrolase n=1 Tax=Sphingomonas oleivorans TaxID=1735121 RepID=A0A2T5FVG1_9SPHN|nr:enoyl-CoA hydratase [Sphingomonas oleivorans]